MEREARARAAIIMGVDPAAGPEQRGEQENAVGVELSVGPAAEESKGGERAAAAPSRPPQPRGSGAAGGEGKEESKVAEGQGDGRAKMAGLSAAQRKKLARKQKPAWAMTEEAKVCGAWGCLGRCFARRLEAVAIHV